MGNGRKYAFFESFWELKESTLSSKVLGDGRKYAFFEGYGEWGLEESSLSSRVLNMETRRVYVLFYTLLQALFQSASY